MIIGLRYWPVQVLGPGRRYGIWFQGCTRCCPGCMARSFQPKKSSQSKEISAPELFADIEASGAKAVTISGGEPFEQATELKAILALLNSNGMADIILYSGFNGEYLLERFPWISSLVSCLIDGPFEKSDPSEASWKGSSNQRAWIFKPLAAYAKWLASRKSELQLVRNSGNIYMLGIPRTRDVIKLLGVNYGPDQDLSCM